MSETQEIVRTSPEGFASGWQSHHEARYMKRRLIALGRTDIVEDAEKYAEERMK